MHGILITRLQLLFPNNTRTTEHHNILDSKH